jgi:hypothetical protein
MKVFWEIMSLFVAVSDESSRNNGFSTSIGILAALHDSEIGV